MSRYKVTVQIFKVSDSQVVNGDFVLPLDGVLDVVIQNAITAGYNVVYGVDGSANSVTILPGGSESIGIPEAGDLYASLAINFSGSSGTKEAIVKVWKRGEEICD